MPQISRHGAIGTPHVGGSADVEIRGPVLLPAQREDIELHTLDDLTLVGELAQSGTDEDPDPLVGCADDGFGDPDHDDIMARGAARRQVLRAISRVYTAASDPRQESDWTRRAARPIVGSCAPFRMPSYGGRLVPASPSPRDGARGRFRIGERFT